MSSPTLHPGDAVPARQAHRCRLTTDYGPITGKPVARQKHSSAALSSATNRTVGISSLNSDTFGEIGNPFPCRGLDRPPSLDLYDCADGGRRSHIAFPLLGGSGFLMATRSASCVRSISIHMDRRPPVPAVRRFEVPVCGMPTGAAEPRTHYPTNSETPSPQSTDRNRDLKLGIARAWGGCWSAVATCHQTRHLVADVNQRGSHSPTLPINVTSE
jgi:hypothetical protein